MVDKANKNDWNYQKREHTEFKGLYFDWRIINYLLKIPDNREKEKLENDDKKWWKSDQLVQVYGFSVELV